MIPPNVHAGLAEEGLWEGQVGTGHPGCLHPPSDFIVDLLIAQKQMQWLKQSSAAALQPSSLHIRDTAQLLQGGPGRGTVCWCFISSEFQRTETAEGQLGSCSGSKYF